MHRLSPDVVHPATSSLNMKPIVLTVDALLVWGGSPLFARPEAGPLARPISRRVLERTAASRT